MTESTVSYDRSGRAERSEATGRPPRRRPLEHTGGCLELHDKLRAYRRNGVLEYVVLRTQDQELDWFVLREGRYDPLAPDADGIIRSETFPGLWLDVRALLDDDMARILAVGAQGTASPEHAAFVARLASARRE